LRSGADVIVQHPLGVAYHPEWRSVRDRWNARYCAAVMEQAAKERVEADRPLISDRTILSAIAVIAILTVLWAAGVAVMS